MNTSRHSRCRLGVVSYLNALPLIEGLDAEPGCALRPAVPSALLSLLLSDDVDAALLPIVDLYRGPIRLRIISDGCIACDGETMTVRVFSKAPPDRVTRLQADTDSHTSIVLARLVWRELYGRALEVRPRNAPNESFAPERDAVLLIGDKVVTDRPRGFGFEVDLGAAWKHLTGLPMVFAVWAVRDNRLDAEETERIALMLSSARERGIARASTIAEREGPRHGWPVELARHYLTRALCYTLDERMQSAMKRFASMASEAGLIEPAGLAAPNA
ncbi:MAG: menaquinone biosynthesis protein [Phycisphaerae bacterium]